MKLRSGKELVELNGQWIGLKNWYIKMISGKNKIKNWIDSKGGKKKGKLSWELEMKNRKCALAVLSCHTVFIKRKVKLIKRKKIEEGINEREVKIIKIKYRK